MRALTNPVVMQMVGMLMVIGAVLVFAFLIVRHLRKGMVSELQVAAPRAETTNFLTSAYQSVIAGLKQREQDLQMQLTAELRRSAMLESTHQMVIENIGSGVMVFTPNLLVQRANAASRKMVGYASPTNMHVGEVFRGLQTVELPSSNGALGGISQALRDVFATGAEYRNIPATYATPSGEVRDFRLSILPMQAIGQPVTSALCLLEPGSTAFTLSFPPAEADKKRSEAE